MRAQSPADQALRLKEGRCPVHGLCMWQTGRLGLPGHAGPLTLCECPRRDCKLLCWSASPDGPSYLVWEDDEKRLLAARAA